MAKILVAHADSMVSCRLKRWLGAKGHEIEVAEDVEDLISRVRFYRYDLLAIGSDISGGTGLSACRALRANGSQIPILVIGEGVDLGKAALSSGADDFMTKPLNLSEVFARVDALLRRPLGGTASILRYKHITMNCASREVYCDGTFVQISPTEFNLLELLLRNPGRVLTKAVIEDALSRRSNCYSRNAIRVCMSRLRRKIDRPGQPSVIGTCDNGYVLVLEKHSDRQLIDDSKVEHFNESRRTRILVVSRDPDLVRTISDAAAAERLYVETLETDGCRDGLSRRAHDAAVVVLDAERRGGGILHICERLRAEGVVTPILVVGKNGVWEEPADLLCEAIAAGADNVVFSRRDAAFMSIWLKAMMRRPRNYCGDRIVRGDISLDTRDSVLRAQQDFVRLPRKEAAILELLMKYPYQVFTLEEIFERLYATESEVSLAAVRIYVCRLRAKIDACKASTKIRTLHGVGYRLETA